MGRSRVWRTAGALIGLAIVALLVSVQYVVLLNHHAFPATMGGPASPTTIGDYAVALFGAVLSVPTLVTVGIAILIWFDGFWVPFLLLLTMGVALILVELVFYAGSIEELFGLRLGFSPELLVAGLALWVAGIGLAVFRFRKKSRVEG